MIVSVEVRDDVEGPWPDDFDGYRLAQFRATLDAFTTGAWIGVAEDPFAKANNAFMARIAPVALQLWDIRCVDPNPGIRAFGTFLCKDTFLALTWQYREQVDWSQEGARCMHEWKQLFGSLPLFKGKTLDDYLSANFHAV
jgi:hypothetical protein